MSDKTETLGVMPCCGAPLLNPINHTLWCEHRKRKDDDTALQFVVITTAELSRLESDVAASRARIAELEESTNTLSGCFTGCNDELFEARKRITELEADNRKMKFEAMEREKDIGFLQRGSETSEAEAIHWRTNAEAVLKREDKLEASFAELHQKYRTTSAVLKSYATQVNEQNRELAALKSGGVEGFVAPRGEIRTCVFSVHDIWNGLGRKAKIILCEPEGE